ncbi:hypothetical protein PS710_05864 [Pseudomonas fluorescens]|uniref:Uncharacterized protein n=1 Tax=Pseudomonas fluorescens TaxID=294 RepID=A0A5E7FP66_PSEFL|nr:hypothetical protein PS710_05864 [Pseudomonas fluorescens]
MWAAVTATKHATGKMWGLLAKRECQTTFPSTDTPSSLASQLLHEFGEPVGAGLPANTAKRCLHQTAIGAVIGAWCS